MFKSGNLLKFATKWGAIYLVASFLAWYGLAVSESQELIDHGVDRTHGLLLWLMDFFHMLPIPGFGWMAGLLAEQIQSLPPDIPVKNVPNVDDWALFRAWAVWAALALIVWLIIGFFTFVAQSVDDVQAGWRGTMPSRFANRVRAATAATAAARPADNEWSERIARLKLIIAPLWWVFVIAPMIAFVLVPQGLNMYAGGSYTVWPVVLAGDLWHAAKVVFSTTGKIFLLIVAVATIAILGLGAMQATILTSRRNVPAGTAWRGVDTAYAASVFGVETVMLLGILIFIIGL